MRSLKGRRSRSAFSTPSPVIQKELWVDTADGRWKEKNKATKNDVIKSSPKRTWRNKTDVNDGDDNEVSKSKGYR